MADDLTAIVQRMIDAGEPEANIATVIQHHQAQAPQPEAKEIPSPKAGLALAAVRPGLAGATRVAEELATNPNLPQYGKAAGHVLGAIEGAQRGGPLGLGTGWWMGGKAGQAAGTITQRVSGPIASTLRKALPYAQAVSTLSGAQGALDLAQMAEPERKDIGFLGVGGSMPDLEVLTKAVAKGANPTQAAAELAKGDPQKFATLITAYSRSLGQGR